MVKKIVLITPGQPSSNPRLVKEAVALNNTGYQVTVLYNFWVKWADDPDAHLRKDYPGIKWERVGGHPVEQRVLYYYTRARHKVFKIAFLVFPNNAYFQQNASIRCNIELKKHARLAIADLYIAHNLGALPAAAIAAKKNKALYAFDAEDYHRGQVVSSTDEYILSKAIEDKYLPGIAYFTVASPQIAEKYKEHYPALSPVVINNVFSKRYLQVPLNLYQEGTTLKLFWFSQTVGKRRGLEEMINGMGLLQDLPIQLTILGVCDDEMQNYLLAIAAKANVASSCLQFLAPSSLENIFAIAAKHHIGLALETGYNINNGIALSNKIFVYLLSGLSIIATRTPAQQSFMNIFPMLGATYNIGEIQELVKIIREWYSTPEKINNNRAAGLEIAATKLNWEEEQKIFLNLVSVTIGK